jgi:hypothetical protein
MIFDETTEKFSARFCGAKGKRPRQSFLRGAFRIKA